MSDRKYVVLLNKVLDGKGKGRNTAVGRMTIIVREGAISLRGEHEAVAQAAWLKLLGKNELGEDIDKNSPTREIIMDEMFSRYENQRHDVYELFKSSIKFTWVGVEHAVR